MKEATGKPAYRSLYFERVFKDYHFARDMGVAAVVSVAAVFLQAVWHLIGVADWQKHKWQWMLSAVIPFAAVLLIHLIWRLLSAPRHVHQDRETEHAETERALRRQIDDKNDRVAELRLELQGALDAKPRVEGRLSCDGQGAEIAVINMGAIADVWASLRIEGPVNGKRQDIFARWAHTDAVKARIANGETCRLILALRRIRDGSAPIGIWEIYCAGEHGVIPATYTNLIGKNDDAVPDLHLYVRLFSDPDGAQTTGERHIVLHARSAEESGD